MDLTVFVAWCMKDVGNADQFRTVLVSAILVRAICSVHPMLCQAGVKTEDFLSSQPALVLVPGAPKVQRERERERAGETLQPLAVLSVFECFG